MMRTVFAAGMAALVPLLARAGTNSAALDLARQLNNAFVEVAEKVSPAVVVIQVASTHRRADADDSDNPFWDLMPKEFRKKAEDERERRRREELEEEKKPNRPPVFDGQGSGIVIRDDGYILTNFHVVENADAIRVRLRDGRRFDATVRGVDPQSDVAVIKINATKLPVAKLGDSGAVRVGEFAVAIGAPFELDYTVTFGHVSAKGRTDVVPTLGAKWQYAMMDQDFIQTDASINPGNSGGPLVNLYGEVIGINTLIRGLHTGIGFAVPVNLAKEVAAQLISDGKFTRSWLGIGIRSLRDDEDYRERVQGVHDGILVTELRPEGPARKSDLKPGDIITAVDSRSVATEAQLRSEVRNKRVGVAVTLDIVRDTTAMKIKVYPEAWPDAPPTPMTKRPTSLREKPVRGFGMTVEPLNETLAEQFDLKATEGLVVTAVERRSAAARHGIVVGDLITAINHRTVTTPKQLTEELKGAELKKGVIIELLRKGVKTIEVLKEEGE